MKNRHNYLVVIDMFNRVYEILKEVDNSANISFELANKVNLYELAESKREKSKRQELTFNIISCLIVGGFVYFIGKVILILLK